MRGIRLKVLMVVAVIAVIALSLWLVHREREQHKTAEREAYNQTVLRFKIAEKTHCPRESLDRSLKWDGAPGEIIPGRLERISEESRQILLAACRAATMDGFLFVAAVIPARIDLDGYSTIDRTRSGSLFTNLADESDPVSLLLYAAGALEKGRKHA